jgi:phage gp29-like protein
MLDKYGGPTALAKHPRGMKDEDVDKLLNAAASISTDSAVAIPDDEDIDLLQAITTAAQQGYDTLVSVLNTAIDIISLTVSNTSQMGSSGSQAAIRSLINEKRRVSKLDAINLGLFLRSTLFNWITLYNSDRAVPPMIRWVFPTDDSLSEMATIDTQLFQMGYRRTLESVNDTYAGGNQETYVFDPSSVQIQEGDNTNPNAEPKQDDDSNNNDDVAVAA